MISNHGSPNPILLMVINNMGFRALIRYMRQNELKIMDVLARIHFAIDAAPSEGSGPTAPESLVTLMRAYIEQNKAELWNNPEEIETFFQDDENFQGLNHIAAASFNVTSPS